MAALSAQPRLIDQTLSVIARLLLARFFQSHATLPFFSPVPLTRLRCSIAHIGVPGSCHRHWIEIL
jgi:hypothetical protein